MYKFTPYKKNGKVNNTHIFIIDAANEAQADNIAMDYVDRHTRCNIDTYTLTKTKISISNT